MASASSVSEDSTNGDPEVTKSASRAGGDRQVSMESSAVLEKEISGVGFGGALLHLLRVGSISPLYVIQVQTMPRRGAILLELWVILEPVSFALDRLPPLQTHTASDKHASFTDHGIRRHCSIARRIRTSVNAAAFHEARRRGQSYSRPSCAASMCCTGRIFSTKRKAVLVCQPTGQEIRPVCRGETSGRSRIGSSSFRDG